MLAFTDKVKIIKSYVPEKVKMFIDENLGRFSKVFAAAGHPNAVFGISYVELKRLTDAEIYDLTE